MLRIRPFRPFQLSAFVIIAILIGFVRFDNLFFRPYYADHSILSPFCAGPWRQGVPSSGKAIAQVGYTAHVETLRCEVLLLATGAVHHQRSEIAPDFTVESSHISQGCSLKPLAQAILTVVSLQDQETSSGSLSGRPALELRFSCATIDTRSLYRCLTDS